MLHGRLIVIPDGTGEDVLHGRLIVIPDGTGEDVLHGRLIVIPDGTGEDEEARSSFLMGLGKMKKLDPVTFYLRFTSKINSRV